MSGHRGPVFVAPARTKGEPALHAQSDPDLSSPDAVPERAETDGARQKRQGAVCLTAGAVIFVAVAVALLTQLYSQGDRTQKAIERQGQKIQGQFDYLVECTTPGAHTPTAAEPRTGHQCYDQAQAATGVFIDDLKLSADCIVLRVTEGVQPEPCRAVRDRIDRLRRGEDPFATPSYSPEEGS